MCGIAGIWNFAASEEVPARLTAMLDAMRHRGPDGRGTLTFRGGAAGMNRLALVDLSERGQQPLWSPDRRVAIVFNGEVYNFRGERERLARNGYPFQSTTDTEVILALYLEQGMRFVDSLRGMYAIALFDWRETSPGELPVMTLVRGPFGIKPLYVTELKGGGVAFSSELRPLLASGLVQKAIDREALADYFAHGFVLQPRTLIAGVRMMRPGTWERFAPGRAAEREEFWKIPASHPHRETLDEAAQRLRGVLDESIRLHALADAPVGAFLSGGIDSTGIVALMRRHLSRLRTYTLRFPDSPGKDEATEAVEMACALDCENTVVDVTDRDAAEILPQFAAGLDQPSVDGLNTWIISQAAAHDVKAVLSGLGGDEWFAGYPVTRRMAWSMATGSGRAQALAGQLAGAINAWFPDGRARQKLQNLAARRSPLAMWIQAHSVFVADRSRQLAGLPAADVSELHRFETWLDEIRSDWRDESAVGLSCLLDCRVYMGCQLLRDSDATSMAHSLELRVPFVDLEVVNFSRSCADEYKLAPDGGESSQYQASGAKRVLIHALRDVLPTAIAKRPKRGFALPFADWMRGAVRPLVEDTCSRETLLRRGLVDPDLVPPPALTDNGQAAANLYPDYWTLMVLELWCRGVLDAGDRSARPEMAAPIGH